MRKLLLPVDSLSPSRTAAAVAEAVRICRQEPNVGVHLLSVQPVYSSHVAMFFGKGELHRLEEEAGLEELQPAKAQLEAAGVPFTASVMIGRSAETIARAARELGCDRIVMGSAGGSGSGKVFGSLAGQVRHIMSGAADCQVIGS
jgi:nucleotide-binding universal stress UspA family protein